MEWWQILVVGMGLLGTAAALTYGVLVAVVREKERIYQQREREEKRREEERTHFALFPLGLDEEAARSKLPGFLTRQGVKVATSKRTALFLKMTTKKVVCEVSRLPTSKEIGEAWFEEWYQKEGKYQSFKPKLSVIEVQPAWEASHVREARNQCPEPTQIQWDEITIRLSETKISQVFEISLEADGELLLQGDYTNLEQAADDIRAFLLALEPDLEMMTEAQWEQDRSRMTTEAEEGGEVVKLKRG